MTRPLPKLLEMIAALVAIPSVSSTQPELDQGNRVVIDLLANWLETLGFAVTVMPIAGHPHKANLIATLGGGPGGLVLAGHTDTVPCNPSLWRSDPFRLTERDNRLYGLGTVDMKGFMALAIEAATAFTDQNFNRPLTLVATADEESSMAGSKTLVSEGKPRADYAVIGEPTGLRPVRTHKGVMMEGITVHGRAGHSSDPALGINALEIMHGIMTRLLDWRMSLQARYRNTDFHVPVPTLNLGHIHGGDNPNRICPECQLWFDLRTLPGMDQEELRQQIHHLVNEAVRGTGATADFSPITPNTPAMHTDQGSPIVQAAEQLTGHPAGAAAFCTEGPYYNELGMQTVILGPGDIDQAHQADESLALDRLQPTVDLLKQLIVRFCMKQ
jgi:acetylornithine deacetylase